MIKIVESKSFVLALLTLVAAIAGHEGLNIPVPTVIGLLTPLMIAIGAAGWSDVVQMKARMTLEHDMKMHALVHGNTIVEGVARNAAGACVANNAQPTPSRDLQAGFAKLGVMIGIAALIGSLLLGTSMLANEGCGASPPPIVTDIVDCVKAEAVVTTDGFSITQVINAVYGAIASIVSGGLPGAIAVLSNIATTWGPDLVACVIDDYPTTGGGSGSGSAAPPASTQLALMLPPIDPATKAQLIQQFAPNKKLNHGKTK